MKRQREDPKSSAPSQKVQQHLDDDDLGGNFAADASDAEDAPEHSVPYLDAVDEDGHASSSEDSDSEIDEEKKAAKAAKKQRMLDKLAARKAAKRKAGGQLNPSAFLLDQLKEGGSARAAEAFWSAYLQTPAGGSLSSLERSAAPSASSMVQVSAEALLTSGGVGAQTSGAKTMPKPVPTPAPALYAHGSSLDELPAFIKAACGEGSSGARWKQLVGWKSAAVKLPKGSPAVLILTYAAARAADMLKTLSCFKCRIGKLFAKHLKVSEQIQQLQSGPTPPIAVGTPARLLQLLDSGALSLEACELIVWDCRPGPKGETALTPLPIVRTGSGPAGQDAGGVGKDKGPGPGAGADLARSSWELFGKYVHPRLQDASSSGTGSAQPRLRMAFF